MDIKKLEKLSCLHLDEKEIPAMQASLQEVLEMMQSMHNVSVQAPEQKPALTVFVSHREGETFSTHTLSEGYFLAPKVIKKD